jgi:hypothetical protein
MSSLRRKQSNYTFATERKRLEIRQQNKIRDLIYRIKMRIKQAGEQDPSCVLIKKPETLFIPRETVEKKVAPYFQDAIDFLNNHLRTHFKKIY